MDHPTQAAPEPTPEPEPQPAAQPKPAAKAEPAPETKPAPAAGTPPTAETPAAATAEPEAELAPEPGETPTPAPEATSVPDDDGTLTSEPEAAPTPATEATSAPEPEATPTAKAETTPAAEPEAAPTPASEATATPQPDGTPTPEAASTPDPAATPTPEPALQYQFAAEPGIQTPAGSTYFDPDTIPIPVLAKPPRVIPPRDPLAVALGNGSLLGIGYGMLGRRVLTTLAIIVTAVLVTLLATTIRTLWFEIVVLGWWVVVIAHGWYLATKQSRPADQAEAKRQRFVALAITLPVILVVGALRYDSARIDSAVADARAAGDCAQALEVLDARWVGHRIANAPLSVAGDDTVAACNQLQKAGVNFDAALTGDAEALRVGIGRLRSVLNLQPGHDEMVERVLERFLDRLPTDDACSTKVLTDWLGHAPRDKSMLDRAVDIVPQIAPEAMVECGDNLMAASNWTLARERYQQLLDEYPDHDLAPRAQEGVTKATQALELANVRQLLTTTTGGQPSYCTTPAPYSGAVAYGATRPNRALFYGNAEYTDRLPAEWKATDAADAVLIVCAGASEFGTPVETCPYEAPISPLGYTDVTFKRVAIPVRVFEVKTGRLVADLRVEIGGASCPPILQYTGFSALGPPSEVYVTPSDPDVHAGFTTLINP